jgi:hypothetical protein
VIARFAPESRMPPSSVETRPPVPSLRSGVGHKGAHVGMTRDPGPVPGKDPLAEGVLLAEPQSAHTGSFEPEVESSDPGE